MVHIRGWTFFIAEMAQCDQLYKTKVRVHNKIYQVILLQDAFEDLRVNGIASSVVNSLDTNTSVATVIGSFFDVN